MSAAVAVIAVWGMTARAAEDAMIGNAQRELKRQQFYYGEITNTLDEPTKAAVRRFQIRRGLDVTGELDSATLTVLATREASPSAAGSSEAQSAEGPPPARERSQNVVRDDMDILRELEAEGNVPPPQREGLSRRATSGTAPSSSASGERAAESGDLPARRSLSSREKPAPATEAAAPRQISQAEPGEKRSAETESERTPPPGTRSDFPIQRVPRAEEESSTLATETEARGISRREILETVDRFVDSWHQPTPERELSFYADSVNYFDQGKTAHGAIARDQRNYYRRWPKREYTLLNKPEVVQAGDDSATVRYRFRYELRNASKAARGRAEHFVRFERERDGLKVVSVRERKITD